MSPTDVSGMGTRLLLRMRRLETRDTDPASGGLKMMMGHRHPLLPLRLGHNLQRRGLSGIDSNLELGPNSDPGPEMSKEKGRFKINEIISFIDKSLETSFSQSAI